MLSKGIFTNVLCLINFLAEKHLYNLHILIDIIIKLLFDFVIVKNDVLINKNNIKIVPQKRCWYNIGSPPPAASKNDVLKFLSVKIIVIAPARTGKDNNSNTAVITTAHPNKTSLCSLTPGLLIFNIVVMKFRAPNKLLIPERCKANIAKSTLGPLWLCTPDKGG